jgi:superoxide dismutase, Cu-Zn family
MRRIFLLAASSTTFIGILAFSVLAQSGLPSATEAATFGTIFARASVVGASGQAVGTVEFAEGEDGKILITANFVGLPPGFRGFNLQDHGGCDMGPNPQQWGLHHSEFNAGVHPNHAGDFPLLLVADDGSAFLSFATDRLTIQKILYPGEGSSVVIHAAPDNFANIPARYGTDSEAAVSGSIADEETLLWGDSGEHIACGGVESVEMPDALEPTTVPEGD